MIRPRFQPRSVLFIAMVAIVGVSSVAHGEQPPAMSPPPAEIRTAPPPRTRPQIIYRLPRNSNYAATLHSQDKTHGNPPPIASGSPPSLQPRAPTNEAVAREQQQLQQRKQQETAKTNSSRSQQVKPSKFHSNQPQMRKHGPGKGGGHGPSRGKGRKK